MIRAVPTVAALAPYALADLGDPAAISLAQNESALPPSPRAIEALATLPHELYPDPDWHALRLAAGAAAGVDGARILCGAGSMELIGAIIRAFAGPGDEVLAPEYGYLYVATAAATAGARYVTVPEDAFRVDIDALLSGLTARTRIVFLCNPGNPTGTAIPNRQIVTFRARLPADVLLVVDQAYGEFDEQAAAPVFALVDRGDTIVLRTLSKAYGLAGARVGWGLFPAGVGVEVRKLLNPNNLSAASQAMAAAALSDQAYMSSTVAEIAARRDRFVAALRGMGLAIPESRTNFALIPFTDAATAGRADSALRARGLVLRGMGGYGLPQCLRATIGPQGTMDAVAEVIGGVMRG